MSLHAQLSPEAESKLDSQKRNSVITSVVISILVLALVVLVLLFVLLPAINLTAPTIVSYQGSNLEEDKMQEKEVNDQLLGNRFFKLGS